MNVARSETLSPAAHKFIDSVLRLKPSVAAFDCDGTLWSGDAGERFFDWEFTGSHVFPDDAAREGLSRKWRDRYAAYKRGEVDESTMCGEMVTLHEGLIDSHLMLAAGRFFHDLFVEQIFPDMQQLVRLLRETGCEIWAVSSSNEWIIRAAMKHFGIPEDHVLAAKVHLDGNVATGRLLRVPSGSGKPQALRGVVGADLDVAFGNSRWDTEMLALAKHPFAINPNADLESLARERGWQIYFPEGTSSRL